MEENKDINVEETDKMPSNTDNTTKTTDSQEKKSGFLGRKNSKESKLKIENEALNEKISKLEADKLELNDKFLRLYSEFDNFKKRNNKERLELISTASEKVIVQLLPVIDDFERAINANEKTEDIAAIKSGFELIYNKILGVLKRFDVEEIEAKGLPFDTDFHEAVTNFPTQNEEDKGKVIDVTEKGYKIKDKVIRYSKVVVAN
jgi:molecular chaperone GrpE